MRIVTCLEKVVYCKGKADGRLNGISDATADCKPPTEIAWDYTSLKCTVIIHHPTGIAFTGGAKGTTSIKRHRGKEEEFLTLIPLWKTDG